MSQQLGPLDVSCDSPPYHIVQACSRVGFETPEDVRWCRFGQSDMPAGWRQLIHFTPWNVLMGSGQQSEKSCGCGQRLPRLETYTFTLITGKELSYVLGQCSRCHAIFWDDA
jgi:hypothetical protein